MSQLTDLRAMVRAYSMQDENSLPDATLDGFILVAESRINRSLWEHGRMQSEKSFTLAAGASDLPLETRNLQVMNLRRASDDLRYRPVFPGSFKEGKEWVDEGDDRGIYVPRGGFLEIYPIPSQNTTFYLDLQEMITPLSQADPVGENWVMSYHSDIYVYACLVEEYNRQRDFKAKAEAEATFFRRVTEVLNQGWAEDYADLENLYGR